MIWFNASLRSNNSSYWHYHVLMQYTHTVSFLNIQRKIYCFLGWLYPAIRNSIKHAPHTADANKAQHCKHNTVFGHSTSRINAKHNQKLFSVASYVNKSKTQRGPSALTHKRTCVATRGNVLCTLTDTNKHIQSQIERQMRKRDTHNQTRVLLARRSVRFRGSQSFHCWTHLIWMKRKLKYVTILSKEFVNSTCHMWKLSRKNRKRYRENFIFWRPNTLWNFQNGA